LRAVLVWGFCDGVFWFARKCGWCDGDGGGGEGDERCRWVLGEFVEEGGFWVEVVEWLVVDDLPPSSSLFPASFNYSSTSYSASISLSSFLHHRFHLF